MKWKLFCNICLIVAVVTGPVAAQDGLSLLKVNHGARQAGMGGAFVSIPDDVNGAAYNPASIQSIPKFSVSFGHTEYWENIRMETGMFATPFAGKINLHGGIRFAADENLEQRTTPTDEPDAYFDFHDVSFKTGVTYNQSERLSFGFAFGWLYEKVSKWSGSSLNFDFGMLYKLKKNINIGASVVNLGGDISLSSNGDVTSRDISLPTRYSAGLSYTYEKYLGALDLVVVDDEVKAHLGLEGKLHEMFDVRAGYMFNYDTKNFTTGVTFKKRNIFVDYAFVPYSNNLGSTHLINLTFSI